MSEDDPSTYDLAREALEEDGEGEVADFLSEGDGEDPDVLDPPKMMDRSFPNVVFICNVPKVAPEKKEKLHGIVRKMLDKNGENEMYMPVNEETSLTEGFVIAHYKTVAAADEAVRVLNEFQLDKKHVFKVMKLDALDEIMSRPEEFLARTNVSRFSRSDFRDWLKDKKCREQFLLRYHTETEVYWHDPHQGRPQKQYGGEREKEKGLIWCDWKVQWSPRGSYVLTTHQQGVKIWAGPHFEVKMKFPHRQIKHVEFSPTEEFVLTYTGALFTDKDESAQKAVKIFRVLTGECVRECRPPAVLPLGDNFPLKYFLWSNDGKYIAECSESKIFVRDTDTFELIKDEEGKKKALHYEGLHTFQWSPKDNIIAAWILEKDNNPARLVLVEIPSRRELTSRSRTQVEAQMHWQSEGDYLCLIVTKLSKARKKASTNLEIFRIRERNIPVEGVEVKDTVKGFYWETKGSRFAVMLSEGESGQRVKLAFYVLQESKCENVYIFDPASSTVQFNNMFWAPEGQYFVLANMGEGELLFGALMPDNKLEVLHKDQHFMVTDVEWDPSSRYVITAVNQPMRDEAGGFKYQMEAGYNIWTFQGRSLYKEQKEKLYHVSWRPHPPAMMSDKELRDIRTNIKQFSKKYDAMDEAAKDAAKAAFRQEREEKMRRFHVVLDRLKDISAQKDADLGWEEARDALYESQGWEMTEERIEEELEVNEEQISSD